MDFSKVFVGLIVQNTKSMTKLHFGPTSTKFTIFEFYNFFFQNYNKTCKLLRTQMQLVRTKSIQNLHSTTFLKILNDYPNRLKTFVGLDFTIINFTKLLSYAIWFFSLTTLWNAVFSCDSLWMGHSAFHKYRTKT